MIQALIDNGCLCSGIISDELTIQLSLPRFPINPRSLKTAEKSDSNKPIIKFITYISLDLDGLVTPKLWLYVVPHSTHQLILGKSGLKTRTQLYMQRSNALISEGMGDQFTVLNAGEIYSGMYLVQK